MNILDKIILHKREEVDVRKAMVTREELMASKYFSRPCLSLKKSLSKPGSTGIIAEFKRKSPSKGFINQHAAADIITKAYTDYGAAGLSVLTDNEFFGGCTDDLVQAVDINRSLKMAKKIPAKMVKIAESGISDVATIHRFKEAGFQGFLIGEIFMKEAEPGKAFETFVSRLQQ